MRKDLKIICGSANPDLCRLICEHLGQEPASITSKLFSDGEIRIEIGESVRGEDVFVIQPTCDPVNNNLMELCLILDALKRASALRVTAVVPYYGYARQDRKVLPRAPISAKLVADILSISGAQRILTVDLHAGQIQGFFNFPVDNLFVLSLFADYLKPQLDTDLIVVSPDAGGVERARGLAKRLNTGLAIVDKRRDEPNQAKAMHVIGDVKNKRCIVLDDMIDTAGTISQSGRALLEQGAKEVTAMATHPVLSGNAIQNLSDSPYTSVIVTDTIPLSQAAAACEKIKVISVSKLIADAIMNIHTEASVSQLFR